MKPKTTPKAYHAGLPSAASELRSQQFSNRLLELRREAANDSISILFRGVKIRKQNPSLPTPLKEFIESNLPLCFANLEEDKQERLSRLTGWLASLSEEILKHEHGARIFEWATNRSIAIAHEENGDAMPQAIIFLFEASAKVSSLGNPIDVKEFFSAYGRMPIEHLLKTTGTIASAQTYTELRKAIAIAHSEAQQIKLANRGGHFAARANVHTKKA